MPARAVSTQPGNADRAKRIRSPEAPSGDSAIEQVPGYRRQKAPPRAWSGRCSNMLRAATEDRRLSYIPADILHSGN